MLLRTRREMARFLEEVMSHAYAQLEERQRLEADTSLVKTYLLEAHRLRSSTHDQVLRTLKDNFTPHVLQAKATTRVHETGEELFFNLEVRRGDEAAVFYLDASNTRFWIVHSTAKSLFVDPLIQKLIANTYEFDSAWLPIQLLEKIAQMGSLRGLGLDYDRRPVPDVDFEQQAAPVQFLKMQLWGNRAGDVLRILRAREAFPDSTTLSKVKVKYWLDHNRDSLFSIADIKYDGKITGRGTSFQSYITLLSSLYKGYAERIQQYEKQFEIRYEVTNNDRLSVKGEPLNIIFKEPIRDLDIFCKKVFSGSHPFRISGVPVNLGRGYFRVAGIDLHVGKCVNFEVSPEYMRVYLPPDSCGNSLARLYTNLQHHYQSLVEATDGSERPAFEF